MSIGFEDTRKINLANKNKNNGIEFIYGSSSNDSYIPDNINNIFKQIDTFIQSHNDMEQDIKFKILHNKYFQKRQDDIRRLENDHETLQIGGKNVRIL